MSEAEPGDKVEAKTEKETFVGTLMPRPEVGESDYVTIKLSSGYDIGIKACDLNSLRVIEKRKKKTPQRHTTNPKDKSKSRVSVLSTGGTIASKVDYLTGGVSASFTAQDILEAMPEISDIANIEADSVMNVMSEDMNPQLWVEMAHAVADHLNKGADGVVLTHGTDTMHYSSAALSFLLKGLGKPVVFTGAQRSTDRGSADSFLNLVCSVAFAKHTLSGVYVVMHGSMSDTYCLAHQGTKVRKMHTTRRDAFQSIDVSPTAKILSTGEVREIRQMPSRTDSVVSVDDCLEENVALVKAYPGMDASILDHHLEKGVRGIVLEGTALGHVPTKVEGRSLLPAIERLIGEDVLLAMSTQCIYGSVNPYVYSNLREVSSRGVVYLGDMLPETAYVKMMWVLGKSNNIEESKRLMLENVVGELSDRSSIGGGFPPFQSGDSFA